MRWSADSDSSNIEDRRGAGGVGVPLGLGGFVLVGVLSLIFGRNLFSELGVGSGSGRAPGSQQGQAPRGGDNQGVAAPGQKGEDKEDKTADFAKFVFNDAQRVWNAQLAKEGKSYPEAKLVLFDDPVRTGCGNATSAIGPFYCPTDTRVYLDLGFFRELDRRFRAPGDFAQAYVIAHEVGHHVQNVLGIEGRMRDAQRGARPEQKNALSVALELQADCFAGIWAKSTEQRKLLEAGDLDEALAAASAVGDDRIQKQTTGTIRPESFTHGSAADRSAWFKKGFSTGSIAACDTIR